ncbi:glycosyltransferase family 2 protein [Patescibacteria group bacterium]
MKLVVTIPAYNEEATIAEVIKEIPRNIPSINSVKVLVIDDGSRDRTVEVARSAGADRVISHPANKGLAKTFKDGIEQALKMDADIIVNTDADNHYDQSRIPDLVNPIVRKKADVVIGSRKIKELEDMPLANKQGNRLGSYITSKLAGLSEVVDVSTGFRAYNREAALRINVYSDHTYTHSTLISAADQRLKIVEVPIRARKVTRKSRLIPNVGHFIFYAGTNILRNIILFKPLRFFGLLGGLLSLVGSIFIIRFLYYYFSDGGQGHVQSLIIAAVLIIVGFQVIILGFIASAIGWSRKLLEEILYRIKKEQLNSNHDDEQ